MTAAPLVVGFDLDMTLIDTRPGFAACLRALGAEYDVEFDVDAMTAKLGPPLEMMLGEYADESLVSAMGDRFRAIYPDIAVAPTPAFAGAHEALAAVRKHHGGTLVVTGKYEPNARLHLDALGFDVDHLVGWAWGPGKAEFINAHGATVFVGDHVHDVEGALAAGAVSVSVLTGGCTAEELVEAGTHVVLRDLSEFPAWLDEHVLTTRLAALQSDLESRGSVMVAFSGGADSAFLLAAATRAIGPDGVVAATAYSDSLAEAERTPAHDFARSLGVRVLTPETHEIEREGYRRNDGDRCFHCKAELLDVLRVLAEQHDLAYVATGTNADDARAGFRPGIRAAGERGAITPLLDAGLTKGQIREASRRWGLPTWDKPAAACLSSRIAYGVEVSPDRLARVDRAEAAVRSLLAERGLSSPDLRVRDLGDRASVELDPALLGEDLSDVLAVVRDAGFAEAEIDPLGFRSGSMNDLLPDPELFR
ncbi:MAG TPA: HAD hydrolase-like protein [Nocardioidaceae bacterium]|nr:HAD hydrolase-like protein [Nocardioidaceae bacterium]